MATRTEIVKNSKMRVNKKELSATNKVASLWIPLALMVPALILMFLFLVVPLITVIQDSMQTPEHNYDNWFQSVWTDERWHRAVINSLLYATITLPISLTISLIISGAITSIARNKARGAWQAIFFIPYVTSAIAVSITFMQILDPGGILNSVLGIEGFPWLTQTFESGWAAIAGVMVYGIWHSLAFQILILSTAMLSVDKRLYDSANIDGASQVKTFLNVTIPSIEKTIWYLFTIGLIGAVKVFPLALYNNASSTAIDRAPTMLLYVYHFVSIGDKGKAGAASVSLVLIIIVYNIIVRKLIDFTRFAINWSSTTIKNNSINREIIKGRRNEYTRNKGGVN